MIAPFVEMALLQEIYGRGVGVTPGKHFGFGGLGFTVLGFQEVRDEHERSEDRTKWPPHADLGPARLGLDYTSSREVNP
jgi:hypothetical protein